MSEEEKKDMLIELMARKLMDILLYDHDEDRLYTFNNSNQVIEYFTKKIEYYTKKVEDK